MAREVGELGGIRRRDRFISEPFWGEISGKSSRYLDRLQIPMVHNHLL